MTSCDLMVIKLVVLGRLCVWFPGIPLSIERDCYLGGPFESQATSLLLVKIYTIPWKLKDHFTKIGVYQRLYVR